MPVVGFHDLAGHEYQHLDSAILQAIGERCLDDFRAWSQALGLRS